jgi:hypothetical protein
MSNKIRFVYLGKHAWEVCEKPKPASSFIPKWHRDMDSYAGGEMKMYHNSLNTTPKKCVPMLDAITSGYIVPLWADIYIEKNGGDINIKWKAAKTVFQNQGGNVPSPPGFHSNPFKFVSHMTIETPPGYSIMVSQPAGYFDSPFYAIPAIIDTDRPVADLSFPVWIRDDVEGIIEKGIPVVQVTPFKRENWKSEFDYIESEEDVSIRRDKIFGLKLKNNYFKNTWSKKEYR